MSDLQTIEINQQPLLRGSIDWYKDLYGRAQISTNVEQRDRVHWAITRILANKKRYEAVAAKTHVPWFLLAAIHGLEASFNFSTCLHNGDPLGKITVHVPAGRGPFHTWEEAAVDALRYDGLSGRDNWSVAKCLQFAEKYNGTGYLKRHPETLSPYLWCCTNMYAKGKYVADGKYDPNAISKQVGVAAIFLGLMNEVKF